MGHVAVSFRILPVDINIELNSIKKALEKNLPKNARVHRFDEEPVAFGLKALIAHIILPEDVAGEMDAMERSIRETEGVGQVDTLMVRRV